MSIKNDITPEEFKKWYLKMHYQYYYERFMKQYKKQRFISYINVEGEWESNWGKMDVKQYNNVVTATYGWDKGKFEGIIEGTTLKGYWAEDPTYECPRDKGPILFEFSQDGNTLNGKWGYCDGEMTGTWTGNRVNANENNGNIVLGIDVSGSWKVYDGIMLLEQNGDQVVGTYENIVVLGGHKEGRIKGTIKLDNASKLYVLDASWAEPPSYECPGDRGITKIIFNKNQDQFKGTWGYCDGPIYEMNGYQGDLLVGPNPLQIGGAWNTNIGVMTFTQNGNSITAIYKDGKGRLDGKIIGNVLIGNWYEANSYSCPFEKGKYKMIFDKNGKAFKAIWNYCEQDPDPTKFWNGVR